MTSVRLIPEEQMSRYLRDIIKYSEAGVLQWRHNGKCTHIGTLNDTKGSVPEYLHDGYLEVVFNPDTVSVCCFYTQSGNKRWQIYYPYSANTAKLYHVVQSSSLYNDLCARTCPQKRYQTEQFVTVTKQKAQPDLYGFTCTGTGNIK